MSEKPPMQQYRIGDYARYMGVTPDFLKHYEQYGLITPSVTENGYRFYPFSQSSRLLACMGLRSYGVPLKEMRAMLCQDDLPAYMDKLRTRSDALRRQIAFQTAVLKDYEAQCAWLRRMEDKQEDWTIEETPEFLFLPHSDLYTFLNDSRIYELLDAWIPWMPVVKSTLCIRTGDAGGGSPYCWGLAAQRPFAFEHALPVNDVVRVLPSCKRFVWNFRGFHPPEGEFLLKALHERYLERLRAMNLAPTSDIFMVSLMQTHEGEGLACHGYMMSAVD
ncbi:MAG: MerR family transcriptional regulator [Clostridia bacterium]|nr:MerR family transcriptional regulator [Clostridia bacterium]